jgi:hypothetical protein
MKPLKAYLLAYNLFSILAWSVIWFRAIPNLFPKLNPPQIFAEQVKDILWYTQHAALLEIVHSALGIVGSPLLTTIIQVFSRLAMLDCITYPAWKETSQHFSFYLMVFSWATVEVPRYSFYAAQIILGDADIPSPLFFARYTLFMILYPTGISGEMLQQVASYPYWRSTQHLQFVERLSHVVLFFYCFFGPFMIWTMFNTRKRAYGKRNAAKLPPVPLSGLVWPVTNERTGERSSTETSKKIWAASARAFSDNGAGEKEAQRIMREKNWRWNYVSYISRNVSMNCESPEDALNMARAGLAEARKQFQFIRDGISIPVDQMMNSNNGNNKKLFVGSIQGNNNNASKPPPSQLQVPYRGKTLSDDTLFHQIDEWVARGTIEESAGTAIKMVAHNSKTWLNLSGVHVAMLGASSAMGPFDSLIAHGATVVAIDLPRPKIWKMLIEKVRNSPGRIVFPLSKEQSTITNDDDLFNSAGCDMLAHTPELITWLSQLDTGGKPLTIGNYTYLDGALYVQLALAGEIIMEKLCKIRPDTRLAFLCTPTDDHLIPESARDAARANARKAPMWQKLLAMIGVLKPNYLIPKKNGLCIVDAMVSRQGPNYALAKRLQHWRAIVSRAEGKIVSSNVAPSTYTLSVVSNPQFKAGYSGWKYFRPLEVFMPETSNTVMFALLCHDLFNPDCKSKPEYKLDHPLSLFTLGSFHGGIWRCAYTIESVGIPAALTYYIPRAMPYLVGGVAVLWAQYQYIVTGKFF